MKIAIACWDGGISPVFDVSRSLLLVTVNRRGRVVGERQIELHSEQPLDRAEKLQRLGIQQLICGAISAPFETALIQCGIEPHSFLCGDMKDLLKAIQNSLPIDALFVMPGCQRRRHVCFRSKSEFFGKTTGIHPSQNH